MPCADNAADIAGTFIAHRGQRFQSTRIVYIAGENEIATGGTKLRRLFEQRGIVLFDNLES